MKQETLEEIKQSYFKNGFKEGAKWQQERMYGEEDMKSFADWCRNGLLNTEYSVYRLNGHLEQWKQFKNK